MPLFVVSECRQKGVSRYCPVFESLTVSYMVSDIPSGSRPSISCAEGFMRYRTWNHDSEVREVHWLHLIGLGDVGNLGSVFLVECRAREAGVSSEQSVDVEICQIMSSN